MTNAVAPRLALIAALLLPPAVGISQEWTRFRGPNGSGVGQAEGLPAQFTMADYAWIADLTGSGHSSPVLWGENVFVTVVGNEGSVRRLVCINADNGKQKWARVEPFSEHHKHHFNSFASSTPVVDAERVYVVWTNGGQTRVMAHSHDGEEAWARVWPGFSSDHGSAASPILVEGTLVFHTDSKTERKSLIVGLDPATGETRWERIRTTSTDAKEHLTAYSTPTTTTFDGKTAITLLSTNHGWHGLDPATGEILWQHPDASYKFRSVGSLVAHENIVFGTMGAGGAGKQSAALEAHSGSPKVLFELGIKDGLSYVPTPIIHDGLLYLWGDGGVLACRDLTTGESIYKERVGQGQFFSSPVLADGKIYCGTRDGRMFVVAAGREYRFLGESQVGAGIHATPAIANNRLYIRTDTHLICLPRRGE